jgi:hypothetical protein
MRKIALAAAVLLVAGAASAKTYKYTLVGNTGTVYCDGLTVSTTNNVVYTGTHTGSCQSNQPADGWAARIKGYIPVIDVSTEYSDAPDVVYTFIFSTKVLAWELWTDEGGVWTEINYGSLQKGAPQGGARGIASSVKSARQAPAGQGLRW